MEDAKEREKEIASNKYQSCLFGWVLSALQAHGDHAHAITQQGGKHGQATHMGENTAKNDGYFVQDAVINNATSQESWRARRHQ